MKPSFFGNLLIISCIFASISCTKSQTEQKISGKIEITPELRGTIQPSAALYVIARYPGQPSGPPVAVKRYTQPLIFPIEFSLTPQDAMLPDIPFQGQLSISVRIAQTGSASPAQSGDIEGNATPNPVTVGEQNLKIFLNQKR